MMSEVIRNQYRNVLIPTCHENWKQKILKNQKVQQTITFSMKQYAQIEEGCEL